MKDKIEQISYGDGETNFFGAQTSQELQEILNKSNYFEQQALAAKVGVSPRHNKGHIKGAIVQAFREYQGRNGPKSQPKPMFADAPEDVVQMIASVGKIGEEEREKRMREDQKKRTSIENAKPEPKAEKAAKKVAKKATKKAKKE